MYVLFLLIMYSVIPLFLGQKFNDIFRLCDCGVAFLAKEWNSILGVLHNNHFVSMQGQDLGSTHAQNHGPYPGLDGLRFMVLSENRYSECSM